MVAWTKSVPSETEKTGSKDVREVELTGLDDRLYLTDERERERDPKMAPRSWVCNAIEIEDLGRKAGL